MRRKNIISIIICCFVIVVLLIFCSNPPVDFGTTITNANEYLNVNNFVKQKIEDDFHDLLPDKIDCNLAQYDYYYYYKCTLLGNPCFVIKLNAIYDGALYLEEKERIENLEPKETLKSEKCVYSFYDREESELYFDNKVIDGKVLRFEIAVLDDEKNKVEYLVASVYDENGEIDILTDFLNSSVGVE